ncbi:hypothetical protein [Nocardia africana]|nr:hypothetical protein [Nocardia africana]
MIAVQDAVEAAAHRQLEGFQRRRQSRITQISGPERRRRTVVMGGEVS